MKNINPKFLIKIFLIIFCLFRNVLSEKPEKWINIFVHGSVGLRANLNVNTIRRLIRNNIEGSCYKKNVLSIRNNKYLFTAQAMQETGLKSVKKDCSSPCAPHAFASIFDKLLKKYSFKETNNKYYTFGWSGLVSYNYRIDEARNFYKDLKRIIDRLNNKGVNPKIRIIGYSHGASVSTNLGRIREIEFPEDKFQIDELILVGMPVLRESSHLIESNIFKKVYHFYSKADKVQKLDAFTPCNFLSHRTFSGCLPEKLTQIEIKIIAKPLSKHQNICHRSRMMNQSPSHLELWFFGWSKKGYRKYLQMYPLPAAVLLPYIKFIAQKYSSPSKKLKFEIYPDCENQFVRIRRTRFCPEVCIPFMPCKEFLELKSQACSFHPNRKEYRTKYINLKRQIDPKKYR